MRDHRLPVYEVLPALTAALREHGAAVLQAPPGAGKTTHVPPALLPEVDGRIVVLEPRRLAARAAARRMASLRGEDVGRTVGYTTRDERVVSGQTRIEVVTEGIPRASSCCDHRLSRATSRYPLHRTARRGRHRTPGGGRSATPSTTRWPSR